MSQSIFRWVIVEQVIIGCSTKGEVTANEFDAFCNDLRKHKITRSLGLNLGEATITSVQRKNVGAIAKNQKIKSAIVTENALVRGVITALSWFGLEIKSFSWTDFDAALTYLDISANKGLESRVKAAAATLKARVEAEMKAGHK